MSTAEQAPSSSTPAAAPVNEKKREKKPQPQQQPTQKKQDKNMGNTTAFKRMNFMFQAAVLMSNLQRENQEKVQPGDQSAENLARFYSFNVKKMAHKHVLRASPNIKRNMCKYCSTLLVPGQTCTNRLRGKKDMYMVQHCLTCNKVKRYYLRDKNTSRYNTYNSADDPNAFSEAELGSATTPSTVENTM